jgi:glucan biosynthesis protein C
MQSTDRLHALDAVRATALLLGVVLHGCDAFLQDFPMEQWRDQPSAVAATIYYVIHMFRMSAFYLIAGYFGCLLLQRRGVTGFMKDRAKRVAIPLFLFGPVILLTIPLAFVLGSLPHGSGLQALAQGRAQLPVASVGNTGLLLHLWFLYYLLIFYVAALALRWLLDVVDPQGRIAALCDRVVALVMQGLWGPVLISLPIAACLWHQKWWSEWMGLPAPQSLVPVSSALIGYGLPFALGWLLQRQTDRLLELRTKWLPYLVVAVALTVFCTNTIGTTPLWTGPNLARTTRVFYVAAYAIGMWCWIFALVGLAVRFLSAPRPALRYLADASYWIYLMHLTTVKFFVTLLRPLDWNWSIKLAITFGGSMLILLLTYQWLVRFTWIGAVLNGRRYPRAAPATAVKAL